MKHKQIKVYLTSGINNALYESYSNRDNISGWFLEFLHIKFLFHYLPYSIEHATKTRLMES